MEKDNKKVFKFLSNEPIGSDLFAGKSQEKTAEVISQILKDEKFQIIGIDGSWGTGKSNLVKIVESKLKTYKFFIYDVWGHQEDDQRRSILIELTDFIRDKKNKLIDNDKKWEDNLKKLLGKEREITTVNRPYLSIGFIFSLFSIIYIPSVNTFKDSIKDFLEIHSLVWKLVLVLFPIFIVLGIYLFNFISNWCKSGRFWYSFKFAAQQTFQVYTNKQEQETKVETISENDPPVRDFTEWMKSIDNDLKSNKLVIVFDNFDRLPKKQIQSIWSSLHVLFSDKKYNNVKVIVPFDREHIKNAFSEMNGKSEKDFADDYINKTFDLVYRVSPPILSDWKNFLRDKWTEAIKNFDEKEYLRVVQAYEVYRPQITPREIIAFINEIVSIKLLNDEIPDQYTALFVLHKAHILKDPLKSITHPEEYLEGLSYLYEDDEDFQKYITALAYQISPENSLEVIYKKQLKNALINGDETKFSEIAKTNIFPVIIRTTLRDGIEDFSKPIEVLYTLEPSEKISKYLIQEIWDDIFNKVKTVEIRYLELTRAQGLLFEKISNTQKIKLAKKLLADYSNVEDFDSVKYASIIEDLKSLMKINQDEWDLFQNLPAKKVKVYQIINLVQAYPNRFQSFRISCNQKELNDFFINKKDTELKEIDRLEYLKLEYDLSDFRDSLIGRVGKNTTNITPLSEMFRLLKTLSDSKLPVIIPDDQIFSMFSSVNKESDFHYDLLAMRLARGNEFPYNYNTPFADVIKRSDPEVVERTKNSILYFIEYDDLLISSISFNSSELLKSVIQDLVVDDSKQKTAVVNNVLKKFDEICEANEIEPRLLLSDLDRFEYNTEDLEFDSYGAHFYEVIKNYDLELSRICVSGLENFFENYSKEKWKNVFNDFSTNSFKLVRAIDYIKWNSFATEALEEILGEIASSGKILNKDSITYLIESFERGNKPLKKIFKTLRDQFINSSKNNPQVFSIIGNWLFEFGSLEEKSSDALRTIFKPSLFDNSDCLNILEANSDHLKQIIEVSEQSETQAISEAILSRVQNGSTKILAKKLGYINGD